MREPSWACGRALQAGDGGSCTTEDQEVHYHHQPLEGGRCSGGWGSLQCQCPSAPTHRYERLEEQLNDLTELHQNEMTNLKQELASMEEKVAYQSYERARDIQVGEHRGSASHCTLYQWGQRGTLGTTGGGTRGALFPAISTIQIGSLL